MEAQSANFSPAEIVRVRGLVGPRMSVIIQEKMVVQCFWYDTNGAPAQCNFHADQLERVQ